MPRDISKLSRNEKLELYEILQEKKRRLRSRKEVYKPNEGQIRVHKSTKFIRVVTSGNGSGKTCLAVHEAMWAALGFNPVLNQTTRVPARVVVVLDRPEKVDQTWLPELKAWFNFKDDQFLKNGKPYISEIIFPNGSNIIFTFHQMDPMAFESIEIDVGIYDEPPPRPIWIALIRGGRKKHSRPRHLLVGTPIGQSWIRKEVLDPWTRDEAPDTDCFTYGTHVNKDNLADGYIESFSAHLTEKEKRIRLHGEFYDLEGLALAHLFEESSHIVKMPSWSSDWPCVLAIDPHPSKKHTACLLGVNPMGQLYYIKEHASRAIPREFARELKEMYKGFRVVDIICDSLGSTPMSGGEGNRSFIEVLNDNGVRARATRFEDKKDEAWIAKIQEVLAIPREGDNFGQKLPKLLIVEGNKGVIGNIQQVQWLKYRNQDEFKPTLDISDKDYLACLKYALACELRYNRRSDKVIRTKGPVGWSRR